MQLYTGSQSAKWLNTSGCGLGSVKAHAIQDHVHAIHSFTLCIICANSPQKGGGALKIAAWYDVYDLLIPPEDDVE